MWLRDCRKRFFCYYGMTIAKFREKCREMHNFRGYQVFDVSVYLNQQAEIQVAAVWLSASRKIKIRRPPVWQSALQELIYENLMLPFKIPGVCLVLSEYGQVVIDQAFGHANMRQELPARTSNYHRIASISKVFTRAAIMKLVSEQKIKLSQRVFPDLLDFNTPGCELITVEHLLNHTVGQWPTLTRKEDPMFNQKEHHSNFNKLIGAVLQETKFEQPSGQSFVYSNFGYFLLGRIIEKVAQTFYIVYL